MRRGLLIVGVLLLLSVIPLYAAAPPTVGLSLSTLNNPFFVDLRDGAQAAAKKMNVNLVVVDAQNDSAREASQIEDLIQKKVAVIAINPTDSDAIVPTIKKINAARIPYESMIAPIWSAIPPVIANGGISGSPAAVIIPDRASPM